MSVVADDIEIGQVWRDRHTWDRFKVLRTYRDHSTNPTFLIEYFPPAEGWACRGKSTVTLGFFRAYCERADEAENA